MSEEKEIIEQEQSSEIKTEIVDDKKSTKEIKKIEKEKKRESLARFFPKYTRGEERFNAITHIFGGVLGIVGLVVGVFYSAKYCDAVAVLSMVIFGVSIMSLYTMSAIYHFLYINKAKKVFRVFDHCTIYFLIAGTYTPICLITLPQPWGYIILGIIWALAVLGIVINATMLNRKWVKVTSQILYLVMGWGIACATPLLLQNMATPGVILIFAGGISYTVGVIFYALGRKIKYFHSIWHIFDILGTVFQYLAILLYAIIGI